MELSTHQGTDKVKRYGWTVQDEPGEQRMLHKDVLQIHASYQRDINGEKVNAIASAWSWVGLGALVVGERGGKFWVIDGHHRTMASRKRSDITHLPCVVFQTVDVQQEARGFLVIQTMRKPITSIAKQKALVTAGDEAAIYVQQQCDELGIEIKATPHSAKQLKCVGWCTRRAIDNRAAFRTILTLAGDLSAADHMPIHERLLEGLWHLNERCENGLTDKRLVKRIREKGARTLMEAAQRASAYYATGGGKIWAQGMLGELNKGMQHKFVMDGAVEA